MLSEWLRKATTSIVVSNRQSVRPSVPMEQHHPYQKGFRKLG